MPSPKQQLKTPQIPSNTPGSPASGISLFPAAEDHDHGISTNHTILDGNIHTDSVLQAISRGSLIYGNSTPKWDELVVGGANTILGSDGTDVAWRAQSFIDHGALTGLLDDDHTQYLLLTGRAGSANDPILSTTTGGQLAGSSASGQNLTLTSTTHATKGKILFGTSAYDEVNNFLGVGTASPSFNVHVQSSGAPVFLYESTSPTGTPQFQFKNGTQTWTLTNRGGSDSTFQLINTTAGTVSFQVFRASNNVVIGSDSEPSAGTKGLIFGDGTALATMASNTAGLYADDVGGIVRMFAIDEDSSKAELQYADSYAMNFLTAGF